MFGMGDELACLENREKGEPGCMGGTGFRAVLQSGNSSDYRKQLLPRDSGGGPELASIFWGESGVKSLRSEHA